MANSIIIGIAGGTGSGKTTLVNRLLSEFGDSVAVIYHDNYYRKYVDTTYEWRSKINYDHPDAFDTDLMVSDLQLLRSGHSIACPVYDFTVHNRSDLTLTVEPKPVILLDGILLFSDERVRKLLDIKIFVDTDADTRLVRRIRRDMVERKRSLESILSQYENTVKPMHDVYVEPSKRFADIIVSGNGQNDAAYAMIADSLRAHIAKKE